WYASTVRRCISRKHCCVSFTPPSPSAPGWSAPLRCGRRPRRRVGSPWGWAYSTWRGPSSTRTSNSCTTAWPARGWFWSSPPEAAQIRELTALHRPHHAHGDEQKDRTGQRGAEEGRPTLQHAQMGKERVEEVEQHAEHDAGKQLCADAPRPNEDVR